MHPYKVGDTVRRVKGMNKGVGVGHVGVVKKVDWDRHLYGRDGDWVWLEDGHEGFASSFELGVPLTPAEQAIKLLEAEGWTKASDGSLSPPKPKLTGEVVVYRHKTTGNNIHYTASKDVWDRYRYTGDYYTLIAIIPWTEGQGLEALTEPTEKDGMF